MTELQEYNNKLFGTVRILEDKEKNKVYLCSTDVARALGYKDIKQAIQRHTKHKGILVPTYTDGGIQNVKYLEQGDVYRLIVRSKLKEAERFEEWVFDEVIPALHDKGYYITRMEDRMEDMELLLSGYKELQPNKARFINEDLIKTLKDQNKVLRAENSSLRRSLKISADRADDLEAKLTDVKENLINQLLGIEIKEK